jgi:hypothetical protein
MSRKNGNKSQFDLPLSQAWHVRRPDVYECVIPDWNVIRWTEYQPPAILDEAIRQTLAAADEALQAAEAAQSDKRYDLFYLKLDMVQARETLREWWRAMPVIGTQQFVEWKAGWKGFYMWWMGSDVLDRAYALLDN